MVMELLKSMLRGTVVHRIWQTARVRGEITRWEAAGKPSPPPAAVKQRIVKDYGKRFGLTTLVETGTFNGDMVAAQLRNFARIYSIELDQALYQRARERFSSEPSIRILQGDSGAVLPMLLKELTVPCLFWLDGHYSAGITARGDKDTPISLELDAILGHRCKDHVILIDDARCFNGENDYPRIADLEAQIRSQRPDLDVRTEADVIRAFPEHGL